jgi:serine/threonine protein kinase
MIEIGTLLQERYLIEKQIGAGGMGAVYLAVDQRFGSHVAIKETFYKDEELAEAFEREAHLLNSLHHPVLPHVSDFFAENNGYFLVMQFIEGEDLSLTLKREGAFPIQDVLSWTDELLDALDYLHSQEPPVIHRDIKPQNLKITPRGDVILLDFGLAKLNSSDISGAISVFGYSRTYSPLEQIQGTGTDARSDIFALGATAYHLLTGKAPIDVLARASAIIAGNSDPLQPASEINNEIPIDVAIVLNSALALNPAQRFVSANAMRQALTHAISSEAAGNIEQSPEQANIAAIPLAVQGIGVVEIEEFPALEAFADEVKSLHQADTDDSLPVIGAQTDVETALPNPEVVYHPNNAGNRAIIVSPRGNRSRLPFAALAAVIIPVILAAGYFINRANSSAEINQPQIVQSAQESDSETEESTVNAIPTEPEVSAIPLSETTQKSENTSVVKKQSVKKQDRVEEEPQENEITEKSQTISNPVEVSRPAPLPNTRRNDSQRRKESTPRIVKSQPVPDIESIFTGRPVDEGSDRDRIFEPKRRRDQMTDEEWREMRRQRRQERKQRQNNQPFPF